MVGGRGPQRHTSLRDPGWVYTEGRGETPHRKKNTARKASAFSENDAWPLSALLDRCPFTLTGFLLFFYMLKTELNCTPTNTGMQTVNVAFRSPGFPLYMGVLLIMRAGGGTQASLGSSVVASGDPGYRRGLLATGTRVEGSPAERKPIKCFLGSDIHVRNTNLHETTIPKTT